MRTLLAIVVLIGACGFAAVCFKAYNTGTARADKAQTFLDAAKGQ